MKYTKSQTVLEVILFEISIEDVDKRSSRKVVA